MHPLFVIRDTRRYGKGVFAVRDIPRRSVIHVFNGEPVTLRDIVARINAGQEALDDPLQIGRRSYLDLDEASRAFNHSCDPNAALRKRSELFALKDIPKGVEITYDYSLTVAPTEWTMACACGTDRCRKELGDVLSIPKTVRQAYLTAGAGQRYMRRLLAAIEQDGAYRMPAYEISALKQLQK